MTNLDFEKFKALCRANHDVKYVSEISDIMYNARCVLKVGITDAKKKVEELYITKLHISKESNKFSQAEIADFEQCVNAIKDSTSIRIGMTFFFAKKSTFSIFYDPDTNEILGVIKFRGLQELKKLEL